LGEVKLLFLKWPLLARQTRIADAVTLPIGGSQLPINALTVQVKSLASADVRLRD
jgi:hypothetical protein